MVVCGLGTGLAGALLWEIPVLGRFAVGAACALLLLAQAVLLGGFLRRHAEEFGYEVARSRR